MMYAFFAMHSNYLLATGFNILNLQNKTKQKKNTSKKIKKKQKTKKQKNKKTKNKKQKKIIIQ